MTKMAVFRVTALKFNNKIRAQHQINRLLGQRKLYASLMLFLSRDTVSNTSGLTLEQLSTFKQLEEITGKCWSNSFYLFIYLFNVQRSVRAEFLQFNLLFHNTNLEACYIQRTTSPLFLVCWVFMSVWFFLSFCRLLVRWSLAWRVDWPECVWEPEGDPRQDALQVRFCPSYPSFSH